jgi:hypothetical protein
MSFMVMLWLAAGAWGGVKVQPFPEQLICLKSGQLRFIDQGLQSTKVADFCFSEDRSYFLSSSCQRNQDCLALSTDLSEIKKPALAGKVGSPGFKLCRRAGGTPELLEFYDGKKWWSMDRCLFTEDSSYVDTGILLRRWSKDSKP